MHWSFVAGFSFYVESGYKESSMEAEQEVGEEVLTSLVGETVVF